MYVVANVGKLYKYNDSPQTVMLIVIVKVYGGTENVHKKKNS